MDLQKVSPEGFFSQARKNILRGSEREYMCLSVLGSESDRSKYEEEDLVYKL